MVQVDTKRLSFLRQRAKKTMSEAGALVGLSGIQYNALEKNGEMTEEMAIHLAVSYGVTLNWLLGQ